MRTVLQVGDIANVAADLTSALEAHTEWHSMPVEVAELRRRSKVARIADLPLRALRTRRALRAAVAAERPDVVHLHWGRYAPFVDTRGVPLVVHVHGSDVRGRGSSLAGRLVTRAMAKAAAVLVSTPDLLADTPPGAKYLPNPVDVDLFTPDDEPTSESDDRRPKVLLFARLNPVKGADQMVAAAAAIRARDRSVRVLAIGGGELDGAAEAAGVELLPQRPRAALVPLLRSVDVVVGQQLLGILSLSELEAMACERPVVMPLGDGLYGSDVPIVNVSGASDVAVQCLELIGDPDRRATLGAAGRRHVVEHHAPGVVAPALAALYKGIV